MSGIKFLTTEEEYAYITDLQIALPNEWVEVLQYAAFDNNLINYQFYLKADPLNADQSTILLLSQDLPSLNEIEKYFWFVKGFLAHCNHKRVIK